MPPPTTSFIYRVESDKPLLAAVARLYVASMADTPTGRKADGWRDQLRHLLREQGRAQVIDDLMAMVDGLTMRHAVTLADLAEKTPSDLLPTVGA